MIFEETVFKPFARRAKACGLEFWLDTGTLLGAYDSGLVLPYDRDIDLGMLVEMNPKPNPEAALAAGIINLDGLQIINPINQCLLGPFGAEFSDIKIANLMFHSGGFTIRHEELDGKLDVELYYVTPDRKKVTRTFGRSFTIGDRWKKHVSGATFDFDTVFPLGSLDFHGQPQPCPKETYQYLKSLYPFTVPFSVRAPYKPSCWPMWPAVPIAYATIYIGAWVLVLWLLKRCLQRRSADAYNKAG